MKAQQLACCVMLKGYSFESQKQSGSHQMLKCMFKRLKSILQRERVNGDQACVSQKTRKLYGPEKPFVKLRPAYSVKLVFSYVVKGVKVKVTAKFRDTGLLRFKDTKRIVTRKDSGLSRNKPQALVVQRLRRTIQWKSPTKIYIELSSE